MNDFIPHFFRHGIIYPCRNDSKSILIERALGILARELLHNYSLGRLVVIQRRVIGGESGVWCEVQNNADNIYSCLCYCTKTIVPDIYFSKAQTTFKLYPE